MKTFKLTFLVASLALAGGLLITSNINTNCAIEAEASYNHKVTGFYKRLTSYEELQDDDKVIIVDQGLKGWSSFGGNPAGLSYDDTGFYYTKERDYLAIENSSVCEFTAIKLGDYFAFRGNMEIRDNSHEFDVLLAHNNDANNSSNFPGTNLSSFQYSFGAYPYPNYGDISDKCKWIVNGDSDPFADNCNIQLTNKYDGGTARSVSLYKYLCKESIGEADTLYQVVPDMYSLTNKDYYIGDKLNLTGYQVVVYYYDADAGSHGDWVIDGYVTYNDSPDMFYNTDITITTAKSYDFKLRGFPSESFNAYINTPTTNPNYVLTEVNQGELKDYRGTYLLVNTNSSVYYDGGMKGDLGSYKSCTINDGQITIQSYAMLHETLTIERHTVNGQRIYVAKLSNGEYLVKADYPNKSFLRTSTSVSEKNALTILNNPYGNGVNIGFTHNGKVYDFSYEYDYGTGFCFISQDYDYEYAKLYKIGPTAESSADISSFNDTFFDLTSVCDGTGQTNKITNEIWTSLSNAFASLGADAQGYFANLTYTHGATVSGTDEDLVDRYDYIVSKYSREDFIERGSANTLQNNAKQNYHSIFETNENNMVTITLVIAIISSSAFLTVSLLRKRKQQN